MSNVFEIFIQGVEDGFKKQAFPSDKLNCSGLEGECLNCALVYKISSRLFPHGWPNYNYNHTKDKSLWYNHKPAIARRAEYPKTAQLMADDMNTITLKVVQGSIIISSIDIHPIVIKIHNTTTTTTTITTTTSATTTTTGHTTATTTTGRPTTTTTSGTTATTSTGHGTTTTSTGHATTGSSSTTTTTTTSGSGTSSSTSGGDGGDNGENDLFGVNEKIWLGVGIGAAAVVGGIVCILFWFCWWFFHRASRSLAVYDIYDDDDDDDDDSGSDIEGNMIGAKKARRGLLGRGRNKGGRGAKGRGGTDIGSLSGGLGSRNGATESSRDLSYIDSLVVSDNPEYRPYLQYYSEDEESLKYQRQGSNQGMMSWPSLVMDEEKNRNKKGNSSSKNKKGGSRSGNSSKKTKEEHVSKSYGGLSQKAKRLAAAATKKKGRKKGNDDDADNEDGYDYDDEDDVRRKGGGGGGSLHRIESEGAKLGDDSRRLIWCNNRKAEKHAIAGTLLGMRIGRGATGDVFKGVTKYAGVVAIKVLKHNPLPMINSSTATCFEEFKYETAVARSIRHENVLQLHMVFLDNSGQLCLCMEYCGQGRLHDVIRSDTVALNGERIKKLLLGAAKGMYYLHNQKPKILHNVCVGHYIVIVSSYYMYIFCYLNYVNNSTTYYTHSLQIHNIFQELNTWNLLVTDDWECKVGGFGLHRLLKRLAASATSQPSSLPTSPSVSSRTSQHAAGSSSASATSSLTSTPSSSTYTTTTMTTSNNATTDSSNSYNNNNNTSHVTNNDNDNEKRPGTVGADVYAFGCIVWEVRAQYSILQIAFTIVLLMTYKLTPITNFQQMFTRQEVQEGTDLAKTIKQRRDKEREAQTKGEETLDEDDELGSNDGGSEDIDNVPRAYQDLIYECCNNVNNNNNNNNKQGMEDEGLTFRRVVEMVSAIRVYTPHDDDDDDNDSMSEGGSERY